MPRTWDEIDEWKRSIIRATRGRHRFHHAMTVQMEVKSEGGGKRAVKDLVEGTFVQVVDEYVRVIFIPELEREWIRLSDPERIRPVYKASSGAMIPFGQMEQGARDVWSIFKQYTVEESRGQIRAGVGPTDELLIPRLSEYTRLGSIPPPKNEATREPNTLYYALEFGTGRASHVGQLSNVRFEGPTKDFSAPGSWWVGPTVGQGVWVHGQRGMGFLYRRRNRTPRTEWYDFVTSTFPKFVTYRLRTLGFAGRAV